MDDSPNGDRNELAVRGQSQVVAVEVRAQHAKSCRDFGFGWTAIGRRAKIKEEFIGGGDGGVVKSYAVVLVVLSE